MNTGICTIISNQVNRRLTCYTSI